METSTPPDPADRTETLLVVDDEQAVRQTFLEWLQEAEPECRVLTALDAESALLQADRHPIDLAILDWNLGTGNDGLRLLEDLCVFHPDIVAILVTGYAHQATPLQAMRMGVRDYLDKNQNLDRDSFVRAVRRQLDSIRPAKRQRRIYKSLVAFRSAVGRVLPMARSASALNDPVGFPESVRGLVRLMMQTSGASTAALVVYSASEVDGVSSYRSFDAAGEPLPGPLAPFERSFAAAAIGMGRPSIVNDLRSAADSPSVELHSFEIGRKTVLVVPIAIDGHTHAVVELFDKPEPFSADDVRLATAAAELGEGLLRRNLADRQTHDLLVDAVAAALESSDVILRDASPTGVPPDPTAIAVDRIREGMNRLEFDPVDTSDSVRLMEAVRRLAIEHGSEPVRHCVRLVDELRALLDRLHGIR